MGGVCTASVRDQSTNTQFTSSESATGTATTCSRCGSPLSPSSASLPGRTRPALTLLHRSSSAVSGECPISESRSRKCARYSPLTMGRLLPRGESTPGSVPKVVSGQGARRYTTGSIYATGVLPHPTRQPLPECIVESGQRDECTDPAILSAGDPPKPMPMGTTSNRRRTS
jgi:hypothetical protein